MSPVHRPRVLLVGGGSGFVGRALVAELASDHDLRSVHRHPDPQESAQGVEVLPTDIGGAVDWDSCLRGIDGVVNVAWYRTGNDARFRWLTEGLERMLAAAVRAKVPRFVQLSVPDAPPELETGLPYLTYKRRFDRAVASSGLSYAILRPSALFGPGDVLLGVMMRSIHRYPFFPMFGDGDYHLSPIAVSDLARIVRETLGSGETGSFDLGGPQRFRYRELTDAMFDTLGKPRRYWRLSPSGSIRLARGLEMLGSTLLYRYEVEWLLSDLLGLPPARPEGQLAPVGPYLASVARTLRGGRAGIVGGPGAAR
jgi:uncharacterized protein YbjT (DUF2867 family)